MSALPEQLEHRVRLLSLNTAVPRKMQMGVQMGERVVLTAHGKQARQGPVAVHRLGLEGDEVADPTVHGGLGKAIYAYPSEHWAFWQTVRSQARAQLWDEAIEPGLLGENLSIAGLIETRAWIGDRLQFPDCELAISAPRMPCGKFDAAMGFRHATKMMVQSGFCGFYLSVTEGGSLSAGQEAQLLPGPRQVTIAEVFKSRAGRAYLR